MESFMGSAGSAEFGGGSPLRYGSSNGSFGSGGAGTNVFPFYLFSVVLGEDKE